MYLGLPIVQNFRQGMIIRRTGRQASSQEGKAGNVGFRITPFLSFLAPSLPPRLAVYLLYSTPVTLFYFLFLFLFLFLYAYLYLFILEGLEMIVGFFSCVYMFRLRSYQMGCKLKVYVYIVCLLEVSLL
jgi:hypothetical protein